MSRCPPRRRSVRHTGASADYQRSGSILSRYRQQHPLLLKNKALPVGTRCCWSRVTWWKRRRRSSGSLTASCRATPVRMLLDKTVNLASQVEFESFNRQLERRQLAIPAANWSTRCSRTRTRSSSSVRRRLPNRQALIDALRDRSQRQAVGGTLSSGSIKAG